MYKIINKYIQSAVKAYCDSKGVDIPSVFYLLRPPDYKMGDYATNIAMAIAEKVRGKPEDIARDIAALVDDSENILEEEPQVAKGGFLNFKIKKENWFRYSEKVIRSKKFTFTNLSKGGEKINVEFVSANPTGPLHVGHGRGAVFGDTLVRLLRACGYDVSAEYYVNDRGKQIRNLGISLHYRYNELFNSNYSPPEDSDWYRGEYLKEIAINLRNEFGETLRNASREDKVFSNYASRKLEEMIRRDLEDLGIIFDEWFHESSMSEKFLWDNINRLIKNGCAWENSDGSIAFSPEAEGFEDSKDRILVKKRSEKGERDFTYFGTDISYHINKINRGFTKLINIWGADHHGYIPRLKAALKALEHNPDILKVILVQMVSLSRSGQPVRMSKRAGEFVTLREIVNEVGKDAFRFIFLTRRPDSQFDFDIDKAKKQSLENPVFHVQYGYARLCSILARAKELVGLDLEKVLEQEDITRLFMEKLMIEEEIRIIKEALRFEEVVADAARNFEPHRIAVFVMDLSRALQSYYTVRWRVHKDPVLPPAELIQSNSQWDLSWDKRKTIARLIWIEFLRMTMKTALELLGVSAPERMGVDVPGDK